MKKWLLVFVTLIVALTFISCSGQAAAPATSAPVKTSNPAPATSAAPAPATSAAPASSAPASQTAGNAKILKFSYDMPKTGGTAQGWNWFADQVTAKTNGRYKVDVYPSGVLFKASDSLNAIQNGIADFTNVAISGNAKALPINSVFYLPSVHFPNTPAGLSASRATARALLAKYPVMLDEFKSVKLFSWNVGISSIVFAKKTKLSVPNDLKGLKIAATGADQDLVKLAGGTPVMINPPDMYAGLDKGVVDAAVTGWVQIKSQHFEEVSSYFLDFGFGQNVQSVCMNLDTWNSLPPDIQKILNDLVPQMEETSANAMLSDDAAGRDMVKTNKDKTIVVPDADQRKAWNDLFVPMEQGWLDNMKAKGVTDAPAILSSLKQSSADAWSKAQ